MQTSRGLACSGKGHEEEEDCLISALHVHEAEAGRDAGVAGSARNFGVGGGFLEAIDLFLAFDAIRLPISQPSFIEDLEHIKHEASLVSSRHQWAVRMTSNLATEDSKMAATRDACSQARVSR